MFGILKLCIDTSVETYWNKVVRELISITCDWTMRLFWSPIYWTLKQQSAGLMFWSCLIFYEMSNWLPNNGTVSLAGKHLLTHLCCKLLCYRIILMEGIPMYARSKFMDLDRASSTYLCTIFCSPVSDYKYTNWTPPPPPLFFFFQMLNSGTLFRISLFNLLQESSLCTPLWDEKYDLANKGEELWNCLKRRGEACS